MRLTTRFALACAVTVPVLVLLAGIAVFQLARHDAYREQDAELRAQAAQLRPAAVAALAGQAQLPLPTTGGVALRGPAGWLVAGDLPPVDRLPEGTSGAATIFAEGRLWRGVVGLVSTPDGQVGRMWVFAPPGQPAARLRRLRVRVGGTALLAIPVAGLAGWLVGRAAVRPLRRLRRRLAELETVRRVGGGSGVPEVDEVAAVVDTALDRYDAQVVLTNHALQTARSFAASAAHELRTPLASIGANLDTLQRHPDMGPADSAEILTDLVDGHRRAVGLLTMLGVLAQGELVTAESFEPVDLADLVDAAVSSAQSRHPHAVITADCPGQVPGYGWPDGLRCIIDNLIDNAAIHGRDPGTGRVSVRLTLRNRVDGAVLSVIDDGPGIAQDRHRSVFDRFSCSADSPGSGLGLALVKQQVTLHGGQVTVGAPPGGHLTVILPPTVGTGHGPTAGLERGPTVGLAGRAAGRSVSGERPQ